MNDAETRFLDALYRGVTDGVEFQRALEIAQDMFHCRGGALVSLDTSAPPLDLALTAGVFNEYGRLYLEQFAQIDPAPAFFARIPVGTASTTDRLLSEEQRNNDPFVNEFFRPMGLVETLGGHLLRDQARFSLIGLQRGKDRPQFDDDDIARIERLMRHITRALQLRRAFARSEARGLGLQLVVDRLPVAVVLLDADGAAIFANAAMRVIARRGDGLSLDRAGRPSPANHVARRRLDSLLYDVSNGGAGGILTVRRASGARDYVVLVSPLPSSLAQLRWEHHGHGAAMVLVHDPALRPHNAAEILEPGLHLPKAAARLVAALAADGDLKSFAEREGVTIHTARFHLRTALARTGARTQAGLVRKAVRLLRDFALGHPGH